MKKWYKEKAAAEWLKKGLSVEDNININSVMADMDALDTAVYCMALYEGCSTDEEIHQREEEIYSSTKTIIKAALLAVYHNALNCLELEKLATGFLHQKVFGSSNITDEYFYSVYTVISNSTLMSKAVCLMTKNETYSSAFHCRQRMKEICCTPHLKYKAAVTYLASTGINAPQNTSSPENLPVNTSKPQNKGGYHE